MNTEKTMTAEDDWSKLPKKLEPDEFQPTWEEKQEFRLETAEKAAIERALVHTKGNRSKAARLLCCDRRTLQRKLMQYAIENSWIQGLATN